MEEWLISVSDTISIRAVEHKIGCPEGTLRHVVSGNRALPKKWEEPLKRYKNSICKGK